MTESVPIPKQVHQPMLFAEPFSIQHLKRAGIENESGIGSYRHILWIPAFVAKHILECPDEVTVPSQERSHGVNEVGQVDVNSGQIIVTSPCGFGKSGSAIEGFSHRHRTALMLFVIAKRFPAERHTIRHFSKQYGKKPRIIGTSPRNFSSGLLLQGSPASFAKPY